jgi:hypothetical protein
MSTAAQPDNRMVGASTWWAPGTRVQGFTPTGHLVVTVPPDLPQEDRERLRAQGLRVREAEPAEASPTYPPHHSQPFPGPLCSWFMHADGTVDRRRPGTPWPSARSRSRSSSYSYGADTASFDSRPEHCWRCDARGAETDVGLCTSCHEDLRTP